MLFLSLKIALRTAAAIVRLRCPSTHASRSQCSTRPRRGAGTTRRAARLARTTAAEKGKVDAGAVVARLEVQHGALRHVRRRQELERLTEGEPRRPAAAARAGAVVSVPAGPI